MKRQECRFVYPSRKEPIMKQTHGRLAAYVATLLLCAFALHLRGELARIAERNGLHQSFDQYQIAARSERLCRAIRPAAGDVQLLADIELPARDGESQPYWNVVCQDAQGKEIANLMWDGDTGQLHSFSSQNLPVRCAGRPVLQATAAARAWQWLEALEADTPGERWQLQEPPSLDHNNWRVSFQSGSRKVSVYVEARSGALVFARYGL
jgi:hypothetical protein